MVNLMSEQCVEAIKSENNLRVANSLIVNQKFIFMSKQFTTISKFFSDPLQSLESDVREVALKQPEV